MLYKNSLIKLFEEHLFHFRISHVLEMNCFVQTEVQATPITSPTWKWYIKSVANVSKRANTASTSFHKRTWKNPSLILIVHLTNFAHPKWVDIHINFPVFGLGDFLSKPFIHQALLFLWYKGPPVNDCKRFGDDGWHFFSRKSCCSGIVGVFSAFSFSFLFWDC